ncbi:DUF4416 family protein [bacterium]|nr:DUF4416 family protein [bacterium]
MKPKEPGPVKLIVGVLYSDEGLLERGLILLSEIYGPLDYRSPAFPFDRTDYYVPEMGCPIFRIFVSHERLIHPGDLARIKIETNAMEEKLAVAEFPNASGRFRNLPEASSQNLPERSENLPEVPLRRQVNFDPGYMDYDKFVLASAKYNGQKIYLDCGIWADLTLHYEKGRFDPYPWSFPDFKSGLYQEVFQEIRARFKAQRNAQLSV